VKVSDPVKLYLYHFATLGTGIFFGLAAAYGFSYIDFDFAWELEKARSLGIVSKTILAGYSKTRDLITYFTVLTFPVLFGVGLWICWAKKETREKLCRLFPCIDKPPVGKDGTWPLCFALVTVACVFLSLNINCFYKGGFSWRLLAEEGQHLACVQALQSGQVYGKDFFYLYGPMLIYPLAWAAKLFGNTILMERIYTYSLNLAAYAIVFFSLYSTLKTRIGFLAGSAIYFFVFPAHHWLFLNATNLRVAIAFLPLLLAYCYLRNSRKHLLLVAGLIQGQILLFSQEVGICSLLALLFFSFLIFIEKRDLKQFLCECVIVLIGCTVSITPFLVYFAYKGALPDIFNILYGYPKLIILGYAGLPFPALKTFFKTTHSGLLFHYGVILIYVFAALVLITDKFLHGITKRGALMCALLFFGILLFRSALGRSDTGHVLFASQPAFLLMIFLLDKTYVELLSMQSKSVKVLSAGLLLVLITSLVIFCIRVPLLRGRLEFTLKTNFPIENKWILKSDAFVSIPGLKRAGVLFTPYDAENILRIKSVLENITRPGEEVYFFPNDALYYFLFNRNNPTRYPLSYWAITRENRLEIIGDLEKKRVRYIVYTHDPLFRCDKIPEHVQLPEVVNYIKNKYEVIHEVGIVTFLKRVSETNPR